MSFLIPALHRFLSENNNYNLHNLCGLLFNECWGLQMHHHCHMEGRYLLKNCAHPFFCWWYVMHRPNNTVETFNQQGLITIIQPNCSSLTGIQTFYKHEDMFTACPERGHREQCLPPAQSQRDPEKTELWQTRNDYWHAICLASFFSEDTCGHT